MDISNSKLVLLLIYIHIAIDPVLSTCYNSSMYQDGGHMQYHTYREVTTSSRYDCVAQCQMSTMCKSVNFNKRKHICHLNDNNTSVIDITPNSNFIYSDVTIWSKSLAGPCAAMNCSAVSQCIVDRLHRPRCLFSCGYPTFVNGTNVDVDRLNPSARATYTCKCNYLLCQGNSTSVCQSTGQWSYVAPCEQFGWHNPHIKQDLNIPCGASTTLNVTTTVTPTQARRFSINFWYGVDNIPLHVDFRFQFHYSYNVTQFASMIDNDWNQRAKFTVPSLPVEIGTEHLLQVLLAEHLFTVMVDGDRVGDYPLTPGMAVDRIIFDDEVLISQVEIHT